MLALLTRSLGDVEFGRLHIENRCDADGVGAVGAYEIGRPAGGAVWPGGLFTDITVYV